MFEPVAAKNPIVPQLRRLSRRRSARVEQGRFLVEGPTLVATALESGAPIELLLKDGGATLDEAGRQLAEQVVAAGARAIELPAGIMAKVADTVTPQPLAAVVARRTVSLEQVLAGGAPALPVLVLVEVSDPGNAGTLLRSAEAAGAAAVVFCAGSVDPFNPKTVRSSAGSIFHVPVVEGISARIALATLGDAGVHRVGTVARGGVGLAEARLGGPVALVLGSEAHGLPDGLHAVLDELVTIPMAGRAESLNVAMAGTLFAFECARCRLTPGSGADTSR
ncbi:MAG: TrmH family RNA methyltransferase [Acidimicrobiales bacterium]